MASIDYPLERPKLDESEFSFSETLYKWVATVDHKRLGLMYIVTALPVYGSGGHYGRGDSLAAGVS